MCGRYAASRSPEDLVEEFDVDNAPDERLQPDYNVAPTKKVYAVLERLPRGGDGAEDVTERLDQPPRRRLQVVTWGLVPSWAKDPKIGNRLVNARVETAADKPSFRKAFATRRCLLPADGYFEWYQPEDRPGVPRDSKGKPRKQPFFIRPRDGGVLAMAGLYEIWRDRSKAEDDPDAWLWTCTVLTTEAEDDLGRIHDRMPLLVEPERYGEWLDPQRTDPDDVRRLLVPAAPGLLEAYPVSTEVNAVRNNGAHLLDPIPAEAQAEATDQAGLF
jgi:putative SOS response-associated peptidase YedK